MRSLFRIVRKSILLWFGAAFLAGGLFFLFMGIQWGAQDRRFQNEGRSLEAVVLSKSIKPASRQGNSSTKYEILYRFTTEDGGTIEGAGTVSVEQWESLDAGSPVRVSYLPGEPQSNRVEGSGSMESSLVAVGLGSIFAIIGGICFLRAAIRVWRQWSILETGETVQATVLAVEPGNVTINRVRQWEVRYQYKDHFGRAHEGTSGAVAPDEANAVAVGDTVGVRFDRARPEESVWVKPETPVAERAATRRPVARRRESTLKRLQGFAVMLALVFAAIIAGEIVIPITGLDGFISRHEVVLVSATIGTTMLGFVLFMGGIVYRILRGGGGPMSHADVEDLSGSTAFRRGPYMARAFLYRFKGKSAGSSFHDQFSIKEAKEAWRQGAWRDSLRWRSNFVIMGGALLFGVGLFSIFVVIAPNGIKFLCAAVIIYWALRTITAFARA